VTAAVSKGGATNLKGGGGFNALKAINNGINNAVQTLKNVWGA